MLVLSRKRGEVVVIGENIEVTVLEVHGDRVKLGLRGPAEVPIPPRGGLPENRVRRSRLSCRVRVETRRELRVFGFPCRQAMIGLLPAFDVIIDQQRDEEDAGEADGSQRHAEQ